MPKTLVIAEPGCTHEGDYATLVRLLHTAAECGCSCWKPQWTSNPARMCERRNIGPDHPKRAYYERAYGWLAFPLEWHHDLRHIAGVLGMQYACSVYLPEDVATIAPLVDYLKISSFEAGDNELVTSAIDALGGGRVIVSEGMKGLGVPEAVRHLRLHCVSAYPAPWPHMNLGVLRTSLDVLPRIDGLSDHSRSLITGAMAVTLGSWIVETHHRLDDCDPKNPDYAVAFSPAEFTQYIQNIRDAELMLGDGVKRVQECERPMLAYRVTKEGSKR